ncbi:Ubiquitin-conjugating enzyme E2 6 [Hanseniaspora osmophila]
MATIQANKRLTKEYKNIVANPPQYIIARPNEDNILEWHYVISGPPDTPFVGGEYHGTLVFPADYPFKPPAIRMITPNGRFKENTRLCLSMSDFHPDSWNPTWSVSTILTGLLSFMTGDESTTGSIVTSDEVKKRLALQSKHYNSRQNTRFKKVFPELVEAYEEELKQMEENSKDGENNAGEDFKMSFLGIDQQNELESRKQMERAKNEKVVPLNEIEDPEDRIRAAELASGNSNSSSNSKVLNFFSMAVAFASLAFLCKYLLD